MIEWTDKTRPEDIMDGKDLEAYYATARNYMHKDTSSSEEEQTNHLQELSKLLKINFSDVPGYKTFFQDKNSFDTVKELIGKEPLMNVDPVLIFDYGKFMPGLVGLTDYMIVYTYPGRITDMGEIAAIRRLARSKGLKIVSIGHYFSWCDAVVVPTPFEALAYFRDASCIVTDTFHGSVFSIKYNKLFCTIVREMNSNKLTFLLHQFGLEGRIASCAADICRIMERQIDYGSVNNMIETEKKRALDYLESELK